VLNITNSKECGCIDCAYYLFANGVGIVASDYFAGNEVLAFSLPIHDNYELEGHKGPGGVQSLCGFDFYFSLVASDYPEEIPITWTVVNEEQDVMLSGECAGLCIDL
jgi:hypothetical protein